MIALEQKRMRWPLQKQIWYPLLGLNIVSILLLAIWLAFWNSQQIRNEIDSQSNQVMETLQRSKYPLIQPVLSQIHELSGFQIVIFSKSGELISSSFEESSKVRERLMAALSQRLEDKQITLFDETFFHSTKTFSITASITGEQVFHLLYPIRLYKDAMWSAAIPAITIGVAIAGVSGIVAYYLALRISKPLQAVADQLGKLSQDQTTHIDEPKYDDEVRDVVVSVNQLSKDLLDLRQRIKQGERLAILGQLSAGVMHHLRNDIAGARLALQVHKNECRNTDHESLDVASRQLQLSAEHLQTFLTSGNLMQPVLEQTDLGLLMKEILDLFAPQFAHHQIEHNEEISAAQIKISTDRTQLRQTIACLVQNGLEAAGPQGKIWLRLAREGKDVLIAVGDNGAGVSESEKAKLFEPFFTTKPNGIGLGLAASKQIVNVLGGTIKYRRENDKTWFSIRFPLDG
jgi:signal transduction histidine kinase